jgi:hypothetical protein
MIPMSKTLQINQQNSCSSSLHAKPFSKTTRDPKKQWQQLSIKLQIIFGFIYANKGLEIRQITPNIHESSFPPWLESKSDTIFSHTHDFK